MKTKLPIEELVTKVLAELKRQNYSYNSLRRFRYFYKRVIAFACEKKEIYFSEELGRDFLKEKYGCTINYYAQAMPGTLQDPIRMIRVLGDFQLHGVIIRRIVKKPDYAKPQQFEKELIAYEKYCSDNDYSKRGLRARMQRLFFFIDYLDGKRIGNVGEITAETISDYVKTIYHHHEKSMASILTTLRVFLRFLYFNQYTESDMSLKVPKQAKYYYPPVPSVWNKEDVVRMLKSVDRGSPVGKRDYAILLLAVKLGIRVGDIKSLKLTDLNWATKTNVNNNHSRPFGSVHKFPTNVDKCIPLGVYPASSTNCGSDQLFPSSSLFASAIHALSSSPPPNHADHIRPPGVRSKPQFIVKSSTSA